MERDAGLGFGFTKAIVNDLEGMTEFYKSVFDLREVMRYEADTARGPISEVILTRTGEMMVPSLAIYKFLGRAGPIGTDSILGFTVQDAQATLDRACRSGGHLVEAVKSMPDLGVSVAFVEDPEGRLVEIVQLQDGTEVD